MKYIFRGIVVFEYLPEYKRVIQHRVDDEIAAFDYCSMIPEDYMLLSTFFDKAYKHAEGIEVTLEDIEVN